MHHHFRIESIGRERLFLSTYLLGVVSGCLLARRAGFHRMIRQKVSPRGGNELAFYLTKQTLKLAFALLGPVETQGARNVPLHQGVIITPNHLSDCDVLALGVALPRWGWYLAKEEIFSIPILGRLMRFVHAFPIRRSGPADRSAMKQILQLLAEGEAVVIFPEGQLSEDGVLQEFQAGTAMLALRAGVPVVPAALSGTNQVLPYGAVVPRPSFGRIRIRFGKPIDFSNLPEDRHQRLEEATARIRQGVVELLKEIKPEAVGEVYA